jgi:hypothetical protein
VCIFVCIVFRLIVVLFCVMCVVCVLCLIVEPLPPVENPFGVKINIYYIADVSNLSSEVTTILCWNRRSHSFGEISQNIYLTCSKATLRTL